jgi:hypothetical protein
MNRTREVSKFLEYNMIDGPQVPTGSIALTSNIYVMVIKAVISVPTYTTKKLSIGTPSYYVKVIGDCITAL